MILICKKGGKCSMNRENYFNSMITKSAKEIEKTMKELDEQKQICSEILELKNKYKTEKKPRKKSAKIETFNVNR